MIKGLKMDFPKRTITCGELRKEDADVLDKLVRDKSVDMTDPASVTAGLARQGVKRPSDIQKWKHVIIRSAPSANIVSQAMQPIRAVETVPAKSMIKIDDKTYLFNIGRNI